MSERTRSINNHSSVTRLYLRFFKNMIFHGIKTTLRIARLYDDLDRFRKEFDRGDDDTDVASDDAVQSFLCQFENSNELVEALVKMGFTRAAADVIENCSWSIK